MKKLFLAAFVIFFGVASVFAQNDGSSEFPTNTDKPYLDGAITVKLKNDVQAFEKKDQAQSANKFGIETLDRKLSAFAPEKVEANFPEKTVRKTNKKIETPQGRVIDLSKYFTVYFDEAFDAREVANAVASDPNVEYAEPVEANYFEDVPDDQFYDQMQFLPQIYAEQAWDIHKGEDGPQIIVGVCDTGIDWKHPDLVDNVYNNLGEDVDGDGVTIQYYTDTQRWEFDRDDVNGVDDDGNGYVDDFIGWNFWADVNNQVAIENNDPDDPMGHGTHCSGIAAGVTNNEIGIASISWNVEVMATSHNSSGNRSVYRGYEGIVYLADNGADVINCSWGGYGWSQYGQDMVSYAKAQGSIVVAAAGNGNTHYFHSPSSYLDVIAIASVSQYDEKTYYSEFGLTVDAAAPGGDYRKDPMIKSTVPGGGYANWQGTSMAAPVMAGLFALVKSANPTWTADQVAARILETCDDINPDNPSYVDELGAGRINAYRALTGAGATEPKQKYLLDDLVVEDENGNGVFEAGETVDVSLFFSNFTAIDAPNVTFNLTCDNPDIEMIEGSPIKAVAGDSENEFPALFKFRVKDDAKVGYANFEITANYPNADVILSYMVFDDSYLFYANPTESWTFEGPVTGGFFVWEVNDYNDFFSGRYIKNFLEDHDFHVTYKNSSEGADVFPTTFVGCDAVFVSFGMPSHFDLMPSAIGSPETIALFEEYIQSGGKVYLDGIYEPIEAFFGGDLQEYFGISSWTPSPYVRSLEYVGLPFTILEDLVFPTKQLSEDFRFGVPGTTTGIPCANLVETGGTNAVQNENPGGSKTFLTGVPISALPNDGPLRDFTLARILEFFGYPMNDYIAMDINPVPASGHAPLDVTFENETYSDAPLTFEWDFDSDGTIDSYDREPTQNYAMPGAYDYEVTVSNGIYTRTQSGSIDVFDGQSAFLGLGLPYETGQVDDAPNFGMTNEFTVEAWINPAAGEDSFTGVILSNDELGIGVYESMFIATIERDGGTSGAMSELGYFVRGEWTHFAATFTLAQGFKLYLNGEELPLSDHNIASGGLIDPDVLYLRIGDLFEGYIDEMKIWNVARTQEEIKGDMNDEGQTDASGLAIYYKFNEGGGDTFANSAGESYDGMMFADWGEGWHAPAMNVSDLSVCPMEEVTFTGYAGDPTIAEWSWGIADPIMISGDYVGQTADRKFCEPGMFYPMAEIFYESGGSGYVFGDEPIEVLDDCEFSVEFQDKEVCYGGDVELGAIDLGDLVCDNPIIGGSDRMSYSWTPRRYLVNSNTVNPTARRITRDMTFYLRARDYSTGMILNASVSVTVISPDVEFNPPRSVSRNETISLGDYLSFGDGDASDYEYEWSDNSGLIQDRYSANPEIAPYRNTLVRVTVTEPDGCSKSLSAYIRVSRYLEGDYEGIAGEPYVSVYPNPADDIAYVDFYAPEQIDCRIRVYSALGSIVFTNVVSAEGESSAPIDLSNLPAGVYAVELNLGGEILRTQFVKR